MNIVVRIMSCLLINMILLLDISWAGDMAGTQEMLSAPVRISQQEFAVGFDALYIGNQQAIAPYAAGATVHAVVPQAQGGYAWGGAVISWVLVLCAKLGMAGELSSFDTTHAMLRGVNLVSRSMMSAVVAGAIAGFALKVCFPQVWHALRIWMLRRTLKSLDVPVESRSALQAQLRQAMSRSSLARIGMENAYNPVSVILRKIDAVDRAAAIRNAIVAHQIQMQEHASRPRIPIRERLLQAMSRIGERMGTWDNVIARQIYRWYARYYRAPQFMQDFQLTVPELVNAYSRHEFYRRARYGIDDAIFSHIELVFKSKDLRAVIQYADQEFIAYVKHGLNDAMLIDIYLKPALANQNAMNRANAVRLLEKFVAAHRLSEPALVSMYRDVFQNRRNSVDVRMDALMVMKAHRHDNSAIAEEALLADMYDLFMQYREYVITQGNSKFPSEKSEILAEQYQYAVHFVARLCADMMARQETQESAKTYAAVVKLLNLCAGDIEPTVLKGLRTLLETRQERLGREINRLIGDERVVVAKFRAALLQSGAGSRNEALQQQIRDLETQVRAVRVVVKKMNKKLGVPLSADVSRADAARRVLLNTINLVTSGLAQVLPVPQTQFVGQAI